MSLATIIDDATAEIGIPTPLTIVGSDDTSARQLLAIAQRAGNTLNKDHAWGNLIRRNTFTATASLSDFDRFYPVSEIWDTALGRPITGPLNQNEWTQLLVSGTTGGDKYWTIYQGAVWIFPDPEDTDEFTFSYVSKNWIRPTAGSDVARWSADSDESLIPEELITLSCIWRWKQSKSLDYAEDLSNFERARERLIGDDRGPRVINTSRPFRGDDWLDNWYPWPINV